MIKTRSIDYIDENGYRYKGHITYDGKKHGEGRLFYNQKLIYCGNWKNDIPHGYGSHYHENVIYDGYFLKGKRHGNGKLFYIIDHFNYILGYSGKWKNDQPYGKGVKYCQYYYIEGKFKNGKLIYGDILNYEDEVYSHKLFWKLFNFLKKLKQ